VVCVECLPADKPWDVVSVTRRSSGVAPRACVRVYARVLVPCMYLCKDSAAPAHARTRAHRPAIQWTIINHIYHILYIYYIYEYVNFCCKCISAVYCVSLNTTNLSTLMEKKSTTIRRGYSQKEKDVVGRWKPLTDDADKHYTLRHYATYSRCKSFIEEKSRP